MIDVALITPNNASQTYQALSNKFSAIEPPTWALLLAESVRKKGFNPIIIDSLAEALSDNQIIDRIVLQKPKLLCFVVYGQNVNASTTNMSGAVRISRAIKEAGVKIPIGFVGSHVQALPKLTLEEEISVDFVFLNEGIYSLINILKLDEISMKNMLKISGLAIRFKNEIKFTQPEKIVNQENMDIDFPGYA